MDGTVLLFVLLFLFVLLESFGLDEEDVENPPMFGNWDRAMRMAAPEVNPEMTVCDKHCVRRVLLLLLRLV